ncbi:hypothetical protein SELMODRAFT_403955 [Selaginella moellendorffii]|uniref:Protein kinase domain-containing protein n=1 Tax=Selaginella moellendorffii TaxID=88036 RepID=D8QT40_SELML|nr:hypothetical protein SELMODRAFT_403955 [Selaginella moellendorffii]
MTLSWRRTLEKERLDPSVYKGSFAKSSKEEAPHLRNATQAKQVEKALSLKTTQLAKGCERENQIECLRETGLFIKTSSFPRYAAPELYVMSTQTPATALSPLNLPDHYSLGLMFLQMVFSKLRSDSALIQFNEAHESWRSLVEARRNPGVQRGLEILDGGAAPSDDAV